MEKRFIYILTALSAVILVSGCEQTGIYSDVDFYVTLDESNTYYAGDPVTFNIHGNPDNLIFYSGEAGYEYRFHDRYTVPVENVKSMTLNLNVYHRYGSEKALDIYYTDQFTELNGANAEIDKKTISDMLAGGMEGWHKVPYNDDGRDPSAADATDISIDVKDCISNFCLAFHWHPSETASPMDTYWVNGSITVDIEGVEGVGPVTIDIENIFGTTIMMDDRLEDPYYAGKENGWIRLDVDQDISFAGGYYVDDPKKPAGNAGIDHYCEGWLFSAARPFNSMEADKSLTVKNIQNSIQSYSYTYETAGTYTATFVGTNTDYLGSSEEVKSLQVTVIPRQL